MNSTELLVREVVDMKIKKMLLSIMLSISMTVTMFPYSVFAAGEVPDLTTCEPIALPEIVSGILSTILIILIENFLNLSFNSSSVIPIVK